jgi:hypothetical protein
MSGQLISMSEQFETMSWQFITIEESIPHAVIPVNNQYLIN